MMLDRRFQCSIVQCAYLAAILCALLSMFVSFLFFIYFAGRNFLGELRLLLVLVYLFVALFCSFIVGKITRLKFIDKVLDCETLY